MAWYPDPNLATSAMFGGVRSGGALADLMRTRRREGELQQLAQSFGQNQNYEQLGTGLLGMGEVGAGINAFQVPYQRKQQALQQEFQNQQAQAAQDYRNNSLALQRAQLDAGLYKDSIGKIPDGYAMVDPRNPQAGLKPLPGAPDAGGVFGGTSVEAQSLNFLVKTGELSPQQAAQLGAGKQITGPNGEILFMTPQGIMGQYPNGSPFPYQGGPIEASGQVTQAPQAAQPTTSNQPPAQRNAIPLTAPKDKTTEKQRNDASTAQAAISSLNTALDDYVKMVGKTGYAVLPGKERDAVLTSRRNIQMQMKELYNLGVLNGPDLELMDQMLFNAAPGMTELPVAAIDGMTPFGTGAAGRSEANAKQLKAQFQDILENRLKAIGRNVDAVGSGKRMRYNAATGQIE